MSDDTGNNETEDDDTGPNDGTSIIFSERHPFYSTGAQLDGSADLLKLTLTAVADWRDAAPGSTTRWICADEEQLTFWIEIFNPSGTAIADCAGWGFEGEFCP